MKTAKFSPFLAIAALVAALALAPSAVAQNSSSSAYGGEGGEVVSTTSGGGNSGDPDGTATASSGSLPFTGLDLTLLVGGGLILIGIGVGMARMVPRHNAT